MKKIHIQLLLILLLFPVLSFSQSMIIDQNGKLLIDGQNGVGIHTPQININSGETSYGGGNGALVLCNTNRTNNNWLRFSFLTTLTNGNQLDLANIGVQYNSHTAGQQVGSMHFLRMFTTCGSQDFQ